MRGKKYGKYIATQQVRRFRYPDCDSLPMFDYIDALGEHPHAKRKLEYAGSAIPSEDELWPLVSDRNRFLADQTIRRLCVTVEGGVGKTKLLEELETTVAYDCPNQVVLRFELRELPTAADYFLESGPQLLARRAWTELTALRKEFAAHGQPFPESESRDGMDVIPAEILSMVQRAARTGDLCLILDAFDQLDKQAAADRARALKDFLSSKYYPKIRCVIAGRPYAIKRVWDDLELGSMQSLTSEAASNDQQTPKPVWEFCKLQKFTAEQVTEFLIAASAEKGREQIEALKRMEAAEIHLPRTLNIIREIESRELQQMQTAADLYWHAMNKTIQDNFRRVRSDYQLKNLRVEHVRPIVAAVAFAMMLWKEEPVVEVPSIQTDKARDFFRFMKKAGFFDVLKDEGIDFQTELLELAQVDSESLQFHFYSESSTREAPAEIRDIRMSDATVRDFMAAHWAARFLSPQLDWLKLHKSATDSPAIDLESRLRANINSDDFEKFWKLLVGMPNEGPVSHEEAATESSWTAAIAPLFDVCCESHRGTPGLSLAKYLREYSMACDVRFGSGWTLTEIGQGEKQGRTIDLPTSPLVVGRADDTDITISLNTVSRSHARIELACDHLVIKDLESTNGTCLNGRRITCSSAVPGDLLQFADAAFRIGLRNKSRPTDLMYRCWSDLLWRAGFMEHRDHLDGPDWNETPMAFGTLNAQTEAKRLFESGATDQTMSPAKRVVISFLSDYLIQCKAQEQACMADSDVTPEMKAQFYLDCDFTPVDIRSIPFQSRESEKDRQEQLGYLNEHYPLWLLERSFRVVEGIPILYGDEPKLDNSNIVDTFEINAYLISSRMYGCFENKRLHHGTLEAKNSLSWCEALMFSVWCHGRLPHQFDQWEIAVCENVAAHDRVDAPKYESEGSEDLFDDCDDNLCASPYCKRQYHIGLRFPTTQFELYDVAGELWQWCSNYDYSDPWSDYSVHRAWRCSSCGDDSSKWRSINVSQHYWSDRDNSLSYLGLRVSRHRNP